MSDSIKGDKTMSVHKTRPKGKYLHSLDGERGATIIVFLMILAVLATIAAGTMSAINLNYQASGAHREGNRGYYAAETALDVGAGRILQEFENLSEYTNSKDFGGDANGWVDVVAADVGFSELNGFTMEYRVEQGTARFFYQTQTGPNIISHYAYQFDVEGKATSMDGSGATETLKETMRVLQTPLVQYFLFFGGSGDAADLELNTGPHQNSWGRVHTNGDLYAAAYSTFDFRNYDTDNQMSPHSWTVAGKIIHGWKPGSPSYPVNPVKFKTEADGQADMTPSEDVDRSFDPDVTADVTLVESKYKGYIQIGVPVKQAPGRTQFVRGGFYEDRSTNPQRLTVHGLKIVGTGPLVAAGTGIQVFASEPTPNTNVTALIANGESSTGTAMAPFLTPIVDNPSAFNDCREGDVVSTTDIDLYALETWYQAYLADLGLAEPEDGMLIYTSRSPNAAYQNNTTGVLHAIRLRVIDGATGSLPGVLMNTTVATDNPYYIQGDFNTNAPLRGVAVIGDAYNVLSNAWIDQTSPGVYRKLCNGSTSPNPAETTHNLAAFSGIVPTDGTIWSGAFINYPRMHECWDDTPCGRSSGNEIPLNVNGSLINLWQSAQGTSKWQLSGHYYNAPQRNYGWDINFDNPDYWPPFVPAIYSMERDSFVE